MPTPPTLYAFDAINTGSPSLQSFAGMSPGDHAEVSGYYAPGDGGGGLFYYDSTSSLTPDGGAVIAAYPGYDNGNWIRVMAGQGGSPAGPASAVSVKWWGAYGNNSAGTDSVYASANVAAFNAAIQYAYGLNSSNNCPGAVYIPSGTYYLNGTVNVLGDEGECVAR